MVFTIMSILLSIIQHFTSRKFIQPQNIFVIRFNVECNDIALLETKTKFSNALVFNKYDAITHSISKLLRINDKQVERLKPLQYSKGAIFTFIVEKNHQKNDTFIDNIKRYLNNSIVNGSLVEEFSKIYKFKYTTTIPIDMLSIKKLTDLLIANSNKHAYVSEQQLAQIVPQLTKPIAPNTQSPILTDQ